jgi:perosamine synthetase
MIRVGSPTFAGKEIEYVQDVLSREQLTMSVYVAKFEELLQSTTKSTFALATSSGTSALHLAMLGLGLRPGDEVIVPASTYVATANAVVYCGAVPIFADVHPNTWNIDLPAVESLITERTVGVIAVDLYGLIAQTPSLRAICDRHGLWLCEDAAESLGATCIGSPVGTYADVSTLSFFGNKLITCGEGGAVLTNRSDVADKVRHLRGQGVDPSRRYFHTAIGYNYRLTDLQAAVGLAQLETLSVHLAARQRIAKFYRERLTDFMTFQETPPGYVHSYWMVGGIVPADRNGVMSTLSLYGVETRPGFPLVPSFPMYNRSGRWPNAKLLAERVVILPTHGKLTDEDLNFVCSSVRSAVEAHHAA